MLVVGTDESGSSHPGWRKNFTVASHLEERLNLLYPTLARPVNLREHGFNQWFSTGSLIVEVGSCGNTVEEAVTAGSFFAAAFADLVKSGG
jgi:stage II sporulation protein P